jgi:hypothetical protein
MDERRTAALACRVPALIHALACRRGQVLVEYALVLMIIVVLLVAPFASGELGNAMSDAISRVVDAI